jgi:hypothetical protein
MPAVAACAVVFLIAGAARAQMPFAPFGVSLTARIGP